MVIQRRLQTEAASLTLFKVIWGNEFSGHSKVRWLKWSVRVTQIVPVLLLGVLALLALG